MTKKVTTTPIPDTAKCTQKKTPEKPFPSRMQRLLAGEPQEERILDPDNPNLIMEQRMRDS